MVSQVILPVIKHVSPFLASDVLDTQPMQGYSEHSFSFKVIDKPKPPKEGDLRHCFGRGWQRFYGTEWVDEALWLKLKIKGF